MVDNLFCKNHPELKAVRVCKRYLCKSLPLCEECEILHFLGHNDEIEKKLKNYEQILIKKKKLFESHKKKAECDLKPLSTISEASKESYNEICETLNTMQNYIIEIESKISKINHYLQIEDWDGQDENLISEISEISEKLNTEFIIKINEQFKNMLQMNFFEIMWKDTNPILPLYNLDQGKLILINVRTKAALSKIISKEIIPSCQTFSILGGPATIKVFDNIYLMGGFNRTTISDRCYKINLHDRELKLQQLASMGTPKYDITAVKLKDRFIYAISGSTYQNNVEVHIKNCQRYDIKLDKWCNIAPVNIARSIPAACTFNERYIYTYSGQADGVSSTKDIEYYDTLEDSKGWIVYKYESNIIAISSSAMLAQISNESILFFSEANISKVQLNGMLEIKNVQKPISNHYCNYYYTPVTVYKNCVYYTVYRSYNHISAIDLRNNKLTEILQIDYINEKSEDTNSPYISPYMRRASGEDEPDMGLDLFE